MSSARILIFANGELPDLDAARRLVRPDDVVICADGGAAHARALGLVPAVLIGDADSLPVAEQKRLAAENVVIKRHPHDKNETDLELALSYALEQDPAAIAIVGALGARIDHALGNISLLSDVRLKGRDCRLDDGVEEALLCRDQAEIIGAPGELVSLLPWCGPAVGVRTQGLKWPLHGETLFPERSRGISNEMLADVARVQLETGLLLIVHQRHRGPLTH